MRPVIARTPAHGFTLVEVLVATLVFGLLAASAYTAVNSLTAAAGDQRAHAERLAAVQMTLARLESDLRQTVLRPVRVANDASGGDWGAGRDNEWAAALQGSSGTLTATRAGWLNPLEQPRANLQRMQWTWSDGVLRRHSWPVLDRTAGTPMMDDLRLEQVDDWGLRYLSPTGQWLERWPAEPMPAREAGLPAAVEVTLTIAPLGVIRRVVVL